MAMTFQQMETLLMESLRLYHHPVAVTFLETDDQIAAFQRGASCEVPVKPLTFCQWEIGARMQGKVILGTPDKLACSSARISFGWAEIDEREIKNHLPFCVDREQAERFLRSKPALPLGKVKAVGVSPLGKAVLPPSTVHFCIDSLQAFHLNVDYMAATNNHPLTPLICMSSSACGSSSYSYLKQTLNLTPPCSGSYNAGKMERGELNLTIDGAHIGAVAERLLARIQQYGSGALTRLGDYYPGADICKNCPLIIFKDGPAPAETCNLCAARQS